MSWIKQYCKGTLALFAGNIIDNFQPLDFFNFYPLWYDLWIDHIVMALDKLDADNKTYEELKELLPTSSNMVAILQKTIVTYKAFTKKDPAKTRLVMNFFARMLEESCPGDPFKETSNPCHTPEQVKKIIESTAWQAADTTIGKKIGQLIATTGSLVHGLYNDLVTDLGWDAFGPYKITYAGQEYILLIRSFPNLRPYELWDQEFLPQTQDLQIYGLYQNIEWEIKGVGSHTIVKSGNAATSLKYYAIISENTPLLRSKVVDLITHHADVAKKLYNHIRELDFEALKNMVQLQESYQLKQLFEAAHLDWQPTQEMKNRIKNRPLLQGTLPRGVMASNLEDYKELYNIRHFAKEVLQEQI